MSTVMQNVCKLRCQYLFLHSPSLSCAGTNRPNQPQREVGEEGMGEKEDWKTSR